MADPARMQIKASNRISTLLLAILVGIAALFGLGLLLISLRLFEIRNELDSLRSEALPRLVKLAQLSQDASATSSIAPALSMNPTRSEFDTLLARIRDKQSAQQTLIDELSVFIEQPERIEPLRRSADDLIENLTKLSFRPLLHPFLIFQIPGFLAKHSISLIRFIGNKKESTISEDR